MADRIIPMHTNNWNSVVYEKSSCVIDSMIFEKKNTISFCLSGKEISEGKFTTLT